LARTIHAVLLVPLCVACAGAPGRDLVTARGPGLEGEPPALAGRLDALRRATLARDAAPLRAALEAPEAPIRAAAVRGLGRLQDLADGPVLARCVADPERPVREEAAIALGLLGLSWDSPTADQRAALEAPLVERAAVEADPAVRRGIAWALGRTAGPGGPAALATLAAGADTTVRAEALFSLGLVARKSRDAGPDAARAALAASRDADAGVRTAAAFALAWSAGAAEAETVAALAGDPEPAVRAFAARALGEVADAPAPLEALLRDPDVGVRVEAVRGLEGGLSRAAGHAGPGGRERAPDPALAAAFEGALLRASFVLARGLASGADPAAAHPLELLLRPSVGATPVAAAGAALGLLSHPEESPAEVRLDVARLHCAAAASMARAVGGAGELGRCGGGLVPADQVHGLEATVLGELVGRDPDAPDRLLVLATDPAPAVRAAALRSLGGLPDPKARERLETALAGTDARAAAAAADALGREGNAWALPALRAALARPGADPDVLAAAVAAVAAIGEVGDEDRAAVRGLLADRRPQVIAAVREAARKLDLPAPSAAPEFPSWVFEAAPASGLAVRLETDRGPVRIALDVERTPVAAANLTRLVERGVLDGTPFHRIEPGFVAQGGDPHGDGTGGPGYTVPCENASTPYLPGTVGMALGGKDTGGSQFFVTYARTPHLEGRYTAFGRVTDGFEAVRRLLPGDRIRRAVVERTGRPDSSAGVAR
jgi:cyclophilin family peptidyl-prolyl cis-trans isomerase/HEAT repeat protein